MTLRLSHQPYPIPENSSPTTLITHSLSPGLISAITTSPYSRYSKLASLVNQAQSLSIPPSNNTSSGTPTISLPPLNPIAVKFLLHFLETGFSTSEEAATIRKADIRRAFEVLGVEFPPGFDYAEGYLDELSSKEYVRRKEDYSTPEIYEAYRRLEMEEGFGVDVTMSGGHLETGAGSSSQFNSAQYTLDGYSSGAPPSYAISELSNSRRNPPLHEKGDAVDSKHPEEPQSEFHATLQSSLTIKLYTLILSHIKPALSTQAQLGIFRGTFVLIAGSESSVSGSQVVTSSQHEKIGGGDLSYREVIYLPAPARGSNEGFTRQFLVQPAVVKGLKKTVDEALGVPPPRPASVIPPPPPPPLSAPPAKKKGWFGFGKKQSAKEPEAPVPVVIAEPEPDTVVDVNVEDVWIKTENENGLWETKHMKGVVIWVAVKQD